MRRFLALWAVGVLLSAALYAPAEEPVGQFIERLRERHPDLALEYLEMIKAKPPAGMAGTLQLEMAKVRLDKARHETDANKRSASYRQARSEFEDYLSKGNPPAPQAAEANLQVARIMALQAKEQLSKARRAETKEAEKNEATQARALFEDAEKSLKAAVGKIDDQLKAFDKVATPQEKATKESLTNAKLQAELDQALNLFGQAETFDADDSADLQKRAKIIEAAAALLKELADRDLKNPLCWVAKAWYAKTFQEIDQFKDAKKLYMRVINDTDNVRASDAGKRLAKYFLLDATARKIDPDNKTPNTTVIKLGEEWVKQYSSYLNTPEGYGVRYHLANAFFEQGNAKLVPGKPTKANPNPQPTKAQLNEAQPFFKLALPLYRALDEAENDYTVKARQKKFQIILLVADLRGGGKIAELQTFEEASLRAQLEIAQMINEQKELEKYKKALPPVMLDAQKKEVEEKEKKIEDGRKKHFQNVVEAIKHALKLAPKANPEVSQQELADSRSLLAYAYLMLGEYTEAAIWAEDFARNYPGSNRATLAATHAMDAYSRLVADSEKALAALPEDKASDADRKRLQSLIDADRGRLYKLAHYMEKAWPDDQNTDVARHQLGMARLKEKKFTEAINILLRIKPGYHAVSLVRFQTAMAALQAREQEKITDELKDAFRNQAMRALEGIPEASADADKETANIYLYGKLKLAELQYTQKKYDDMDKLIGIVLGKLDALKVPGKEDMKASLEGMKQFSQYGRANEAFKAKDYKKVREVVDPMLASVSEQVKKGNEEVAAAKKIVEPLAQKKEKGEALDDKEKEQLQEAQEKLGHLTQQNSRNSTLQRGLIVLALQTSVQANDTERAKALLENLQKDTSGIEGGVASILMQLVQQLKEQIADLKKQKGKEDELKKTIASFTTFLNELAKRPNIPEDERIFLAHSYGSLDMHKEAAALLSELKEPKPDAGMDKVDPVKLNRYHAIRILYVKHLRLAQDYKEADKVLGEILKTPFGKGNLEAQREKLMLKEDQGFFGGPAGAIKGWDELMRQMRPKIQSDPKMKEQYFDCYFHLTKSFYKNALKMTDESKKADGIKKAAGFLQKLDAAEKELNPDLKKRFQEFLEVETSLKKDYIELGGKAFLPETDKTAAAK